MRNKDKKDPSKLHEFSEYDFTGKISDVIRKLQAIANKHPKANISREVDYSGCWYESDSPEIKFIVRSK